MVRNLSVITIAIMLVGCTNKPVRHVAESPVVAVSDKGAVEIKGDSQVQPKVNTKKTDSVMTIPEGSRIEFNEKLGTMALTLSKATQIAVNRTETAIEGPRSFTPDKAPTIAEEKRAQSDFWTSLGLKAGLVFGAAAAIFGLVRAWDFVMYGGAAISAACAFGIFVDRYPILLAIIGIGAALVVVGPLIWYTKIKKPEKPVVVKEVDANTPIP